MSTRPAAIWSALLACLFAVLALASPARAAETPPRAQHVVVVGLSGLRWSDVSAARTPTLWRLAGQGSVANLVDYAVKPNFRSLGRRFGPDTPAVAAATQSGADISDVHISEPSLENLFLHHTGRSLRD